MKSKVDILDLYNQLKRPLVLDGAIGSLLLEKGFENHPILWTSLSNLVNPELVKNIHIEYINAGADIITTNTFRTNPNAVKKSKKNLELEKFVKSAVELAKEARSNRYVLIAGSNSPAEDCYQKERTITTSELEYNHKLHISLLWENSVDIIWNETQSHKDEIEIICKYCFANKIPYVVNLFFDDNLKILSGENLNDIIDLIQNYKPIAIGFNCIKPSTFYKYIEKYKLPERWGFYFNCGTGNFNDENISCGISPESYVNITKSLIELKPLFIGSCCGSNPKHTRALRDFINEIYRN